MNCKEKGITRILLCTLFVCVAFVLCTRNIFAETYEKYIIIDGVEYDATVSNSGDGWDYDYSGTTVYIYLDNYDGGSIVSNVPLYIGYDDSGCVVRGKNSCGIYSEGDIFICLNSYHNSTTPLFASVYGDEGYAAICSGGTLTICGDLKVYGGGTAALEALEIKEKYDWCNEISAGANELTANVVDCYEGQSFVSFLRKLRTVTYHGNGGKTASGADIVTQQSMYGFSRTVSLPQLLSLGFDYSGRVFLGWSDKPDWTGTFYYPSERIPVDMSDLDIHVYALWDDETHFALSLNDAYYYNSWDDMCTGSTKIYLIDGEQSFILPDQHRPGCSFLGWVSDSSGQYYAAGDSVFISSTCSFTAQYSPLTLYVDGVAYDASENQGSNAMGWHYYVRNANNSSFRLDGNYTGGAIIIPDSCTITVNGSVYEQNGPAITVHGDANIHCYDYSGQAFTITLEGGNGFPAVKADGTLEFSCSDECSLYLAGGGDHPALEATTCICSEHFFYAGESMDALVKTGIYTGQKCVKCVNAWYVEECVGPGESVPDVPEHNYYSLLAWRDISSPWEDLILYLPGDINTNSSSITLEPYYLTLNGSGYSAVIDGNGGTTASGSKYIVAEVSSSDLTAYSLSGDDFSRPGYQLEGFNTKRDGSGQSFSKGETLFTKVDDFVTKLFAQWIEKIIDVLSYDITGSCDSGSCSYETGLGNLIADGMLWYARNVISFEADVSIINGGMIKEDLKAGPIRYSDLQKVVPSGNNLCIVELSGADLLEVIESACQEVPESTASLPQFAGMQIVLLADKEYEKNGLYDESSQFYRPLNPGKRVRIERIGGKDFSLTETYTIVTTEPLLSGCDGYNALGNGNILFRKLIEASDCIAQYIENGLKGMIPVSYTVPEGRFMIAGDSDIIYVPEEMLDSGGEIYAASYDEYGRILDIILTDKDYVPLFNFDGKSTLFTVFCMDEKQKPLFDCINREK